MFVMLLRSSIDDCYISLTKIECAVFKMAVAYRKCLFLPISRVHDGISRVNTTVIGYASGHVYCKLQLAEIAGHESHTHTLHYLNVCIHHSAPVDGGQRGSAIVDKSTFPCS